jgi:hypothetical protein
MHVHWLPRSGHSLIDSLLDAHPNAIVARELDASKFVGAGFGKHQIYELLIGNLRRFAQRGGEWNSAATKYTNSGRAGSTNCESSATKRRLLHPAIGGGPEATAPVAKDRRHRCQVRPRRQEPYNNVAATLKRSPVHVRNPTLSAIVEDYFALLALGDL